MPNVKFTETGTEVEVSGGERLLDVALDNGVEIPHPCGGNAVCGGCRVKITSGFNKDAVTDEEYDMIDEDEIEEGYRLACCTDVEEDLEVEF